MRQAILALMASLTIAASSETAAWSPDSETVAALEARIEIPFHEGEEPQPLESYARYYAGVVIDGRPMVRGVLVTFFLEEPGIYIVGEGEFPIIFDGGCSVVHVLYDVETAQLTEIGCNGRA